MKIQKRVCDGCRKEKNEDFSPMKIQTMEIKPDYWLRLIGNNFEYDFCNSDCMVSFYTPRTATEIRNE